MSSEKSAGLAPPEHRDVAGGLPSDDVPTVPLRHPWRWASAVAVVLLLLWFLDVLVTTDAFQWGVVGQYLFSGTVLSGVVHTLEMTVLCMLIGMVIGTVIAVMRLSPNPVLNRVAHLYQWFFRGTPPLVQLIFWFNLASVFPAIGLTVFGTEVFSFNTNSVMTPFVAALLGLGLSFSAYYSEIVRAGILSVDEGQADAARAYGLTRFQTLRHIVLPQAMRVIIPPTGNEAIGMLKFTSLATIVSYSELLQTVSAIYNTNFQTIPLLIVAALWYLFMTSVLSIGQYFLEKRFARGSRQVGRQPAMYRFWSSVLRRVRQA
ncbi:amino acid ABC transporter permease [Amycolatopsis rubida]|uniref:Amino acid ABC transporter permease n=1 Tax=Amycolatopsis rubida TaxID=112413 RepID=A0ABX0C872_9PSEU|nr:MULTISPECIES: amino acid ABC transporter permease [Amycolatopsis]MYW96174.1 ABC transporter permease subunit [Amycolatopsis rubida]NEC61165.1 amino acid ABC transporter permease [Amycolatopsis rubida]OAP24310.1 Inner membrane amino-acid ABC transporter permease protein YecS [Amycolatopsis sp. M39]